MELVIDTADDAIGLCLAEEGAPLIEWWARLRSTPGAELMPRIEQLFDAAERPREELRAVAVCLGPGGYTGLRVGLSTAKGLAMGLGCRLAGVARFAAEAWAFRADPGLVVPVHHAGRTEYAWQPFREGRPAGDAAIGDAASLAAQAPEGALVVGQFEGLADLLPGRRLLAGAAAVRRPAVIAELAWQRLRRGESDEVAALAPIYLREPVIGPRKNERRQSD